MQLVELQENLALFDDIDADIYAISKESSSDSQALKNGLGLTFSLLSDPNLEVIEYVNMKNDDLSYRGFSILDQNGHYVHHEINDHWGEQIEETSSKIHEHLKELSE
ncbi:redoxin domain-containing protein [Halalkalibacter urbisdiaboli]|uniref:redoxin domain-containing protein n=1 Tax=Halalkalibacter urbisdiaboli TaxID=1960589 RepID=UPI000B43B614|nr:redoxin domain-containing protein [Halalkalibacter urbisdiaboli]